MQRGGTVELAVFFLLRPCKFILRWERFPQPLGRDTLTLCVLPIANYFQIPSWCTHMVIASIPKHSQHQSRPPPQALLRAFTVLTAKHQRVFRPTLVGYRLGSTHKFGAGKFQSKFLCGNPTRSIPIKAYPCRHICL